MKFLIFGLLFITAVYFSEAATKEELLQRGKDLLAKGKTEIEKLRQEGKVADAAVLMRLEVAVGVLELEVERLDPTTEAGQQLLTRLEENLQKEEDALDAELKKLSGGSLFKRDLQADLLTKAAELALKAKEAVDTLIAEGKGELAVGIQALEKIIVDVEAQLQNLHPTTEAGKLLLAGAEALLQKVETDLEAELQKITGSFLVKRDLQADLLVKAAELALKAKEAVDTLIAEGKGELAVGIQALEKIIVDVEAQLQNLHPTTEAGKLLLAGAEALLQKVETDLEAELQKITGSF